MRIAIYTRKSVFVENSESIETQINIIKNYFNKDKNNTFEVFEDEGFSGKNTNRPAFTRMMKLASLNTYDIIAVYKVDRIARNIIDFVSIFDKLEQYNIKLVSVTEGFDPSTPIGKMMMMLLASFADMERMNIVQRVRDNMISLAKKGCFTGGFVPFGCESFKSEEDGKSYIKIVEADKIKAIFNEYLKVESLYSTHKNLKENGITTMVNRGSLINILRSPVYVKTTKEVLTYLSNKNEVVGSANGKGMMTYGKTSGYPTVIVGKHDAIISAKDWLRVQYILDAKRDSNFNKVSKVYWLTQTLKCHICGRDYILANSNTNTYYVCNGRRQRNDTGIKNVGFKCTNNKYVNALEIEKKVSLLIDTLASDGIEKFKNNYKPDKNIEADKTKTIELKIENNNRSIENLVEKLMVLSNAASGAVTKKIEDLTIKNINLNIELEEEKLKQLDNVNNVNIDDVFTNISNFSTIKNNEEKRLMVRKIFNKLTYDPLLDRMEVDFIR